MSVVDSLVPVMTLDGPSGTGKGTLCHQLANILGWHVLDSGAIYRALALSVMEHAVSGASVDHYIALARELPLRFEIDAQNNQSIYLNEQDISVLMRSEQVGQEASRLAALPEVRAALLQRQRDFAQWPGLVTDGRDMGTVVFPHAVLKIYLYATPEERALRRYLQLKNKGSHIELDEVVKELSMRDQRDMHRSHSPLVPAADAVQIDTTGLTVVQVRKSILQLAAERGLYRS